MTDRSLKTPTDLDALKFDPNSGLVPVIAQDAHTGDVLMLAWANREALEATLRTGSMTYWSRSREELWEKGATSGNVQSVASLHADCDGDAVLARVRPAGPACHTGEATCFGQGAGNGGESGGDSTLSDLWDTLVARSRERPEGSYTVRLLDDENLRTKKLGEETAELIVALMRLGSEAGRPGETSPIDPQDSAAGEAARDRAAEEAADLIYHVLAALLAGGVTLQDVLSELERRK
jgi:phosphoribosyl-ATP pyrophosphohydrolase/phosphoribosyl-AMP cyclohydrolase